MAIEFQDVNENLRRIRLSDRLDLPGTEAIATRLAAIASSCERRVVLDLTAVTFLSSMGIGAIVANAKAQQRRGGRVVLFVGDNSTVASALENTGVTVLIPTFDDASAADRAALA
jgi:anti-sigma B factor antagonist